MGGVNRGDRMMLAVLIGMGFVAAFNENTVNVALVYIQTEFDVSSVASQWLVTGYMIVSAITSAVCAFLQHRFPLRRIVFAAGIVFVATSFAAMLAPGYPLLLTFRLLQAIGTGLFVPIMVTTILKVTPREQMGTVLSIGNMCLTLGPALGPVVTGAMISLLGWRTVFLSGAIVMTLLLVAAVFFVSNVHETAASRLDAPSVFLASLGLTFFMYGLTQICSDIVMSTCTLAIGIVFLGVFAHRQHRIPDPFLNLSPFTNPAYVLACLMLGIAMMTSFSTTVLLPQYLQEGLGVSALVTGTLILLPVMCNVAFSVLGGRLFDTYGETPLLPLGYLLMAIGMLVMCLAGRGLSLVFVITGACTTFVALGLVYTATQAAGLKRLSQAGHAHGVSIMNVLVMVAGALGTSLYGGVAQAGTGGAIARGISEGAAQGAGFGDAMILGTALAAGALVLALILGKKRAGN